MKTRKTEKSSESNTACDPCGTLSFSRCELPPGMAYQYENADIAQTGWPSRRCRGNTGPMMDGTADTSTGICPADFAGEYMKGLEELELRELNQGTQDPRQVSKTPTLLPTDSRQTSDARKPCDTMGGKDRVLRVSPLLFASVRVCPLFFASVAFSLSLTSTALCTYLVLDDDNALRLGVFNVRSIGFWCYQSTNDNNYGYPEGMDDFDSSFKAARSMGLTANILGLCVWCFFLLAGCIPCPAVAYYLTGLIAFTTSLFEGLKFMLLKSTLFCDGENLGCSFWKGGRCSIASVIFWFFASLLICGLGKAQKQDQEERRDERQDDRQDDRD